MNKDLDKAMKRHLIDDLDDFGIHKDDYDVFFDQRADEISQELNGLLHKK